MTKLRGILNRSTLRSYGKAAIFWCHNTLQQIISSRAWRMLQKWAGNWVDRLYQNRDPLPLEFLEATQEVAKRLSQLSTPGESRRGDT